MAALAVAAGAGIGIVAAFASSGSSPAPPLSASVAPGTYEVVYLVDNLSGGTAQTTYEVLDVADPLDVSDLTYKEDPRRGAQAVSGTVTTATALYDLTGSKLVLVSGREPGLGSGAEALGAELPELVSWGLARDLRRTETRAGETCHLIRMSEPPAGPITPLSGSDHDDICVTSSGLELGETWTYSGRVVLERTAVEVRIGPADPSIGAGPPLPSGPQSASAALVTVGPVQSASFLPTPTPPAGLRAEPALSVQAFNPEQSGQLLYTANIWTFESAGSLVTVEAGQGGVPWDNTGEPTRPVGLGHLGSATEALDSDGPDLQVQFTGGDWVRVRGTVPLTALVAYASALAGPAAGS